MNGDTASILERALQLSREVLAAADRGDGHAAETLNAERRRLLEAARRRATLFDADAHRVLREIARLNDRSIGHLEHHRRIKGREVDTAAVGRRAVAAYSTVGRPAFRGG
jgi:predicted phage gp36 major capsid-like protein